MSYGQGVNLQCCPIQNCLNVFGADTIVFVFVNLLFPLKCQGQREISKASEPLLLDFHCYECYTHDHSNIGEYICALTRYPSQVDPIKQCADFKCQKASFIFEQKGSPNLNANPRHEQIIIVTSIYDSKGSGSKVLWTMTVALSKQWKVIGRTVYSMHWLLMSRVKG